MLHETRIEPKTQPTKCDRNESQLDKRVIGGVQSVVAGGDVPTFLLATKLAFDLVPFLVSFGGHFPRLASVGLSSQARPATSYRLLAVLVHLHRRAAWADAARWP